MRTSSAQISRSICDALLALLSAEKYSSASFWSGHINRSKEVVKFYSIESSATQNLESLIRVARQHRIIIGNGNPGAVSTNISKGIGATNVVKKNAGSTVSKEFLESTAALVAAVRLLAFLCINSVSVSLSVASSVSSSSGLNFGRGGREISGVAAAAFLKCACSVGVCPEINATMNILVGDLSDHTITSDTIRITTIHDLLQAVCVIAGSNAIAAEEATSSSSIISSNSSSGVKSSSISSKITGSGVSCKKSCGEAGLCETIKVIMEKIFVRASNNSTNGFLDFPFADRGIIDLCLRSIIALSNNCPTNQQKFALVSWPILKLMDRLLLFCAASDQNSDATEIASDVITVTLCCRVLLTCPTLLCGNAGLGHDSRTQKMKDLTAILADCKESLSRNSLLLMTGVGINTSMSGSVLKKGSSGASHGQQVITQLEAMQKLVEKAIQAINIEIERKENPSLFTKCVGFSMNPFVSRK